MNNEIDKKETMNKKKAVKKKKTSKKSFQESTEKKGGSNPSPSSPKPEAPPSSQVVVVKFEDLEGKFLLVKVGNDAHPATSEDIEDIGTKLTGLLEENGVNCMAFVTHHAVEMEIVEKLT